MVVLLFPPLTFKSDTLTTGTLRHSRVVWMPYNTLIHTKLMKPKYFIVGLIAFSTIIGWNILLIQRDNKMYEGYNKRFNQIKYDHPTLKEVSQ